MLIVFQFRPIFSVKRKPLLTEHHHFHLSNRFGLHLSHLSRFSVLAIFTHGFLGAMAVLLFTVLMHYLITLFGYHHGVLGYNTLFLRFIRRWLDLLFPFLLVR